MATSSQKSIDRNRRPRVHLKYDIEVGNATKTVELPFIVGVMADLSGKPADPLKPLGERNFVEIDQETFDKKLAEQKPRVAFQVPNTLSGKEGENLSVDITFSKLEDFSPAAVANKVEPLRKLMEARTNLDRLLTALDGKDSAVDRLNDLLNDKELMQAIQGNQGQK
jgi:type VI secretion system protein ImpB